MSLPLSNDKFATIISLYAPRMTKPDKNKEVFYSALASVVRDISHKVLLIDNFKARIRSDTDERAMLWESMRSGKATPMANFCWICAPSSSWYWQTPCSNRRINVIPPGCILVPDTGIFTSSSWSVMIKWIFTVLEYWSPYTEVINGIRNTTNAE